MIKAPQEEIFYHVLHLASWPARPHLLHDDVSDMVRICALLARRPSVGILIPVVLDIPPPVAHSLLETLHAKGHICPVATPLQEQIAAPAADPASSHEVAVTISFVNKVWLYLISKNKPSDPMLN